VNAEPPMVKAPAPASIFTPSTSQGTSTCGVTRVFPPKFTRAVPLVKGDTSPTQFPTVLQLSSLPPPSQVRDGPAGTISPLARRAAPGGKPAKLIPPKKPALGAAVTKIESSVHPTASGPSFVPCQLLMVTVPFPIRDPAVKVSATLLAFVGSRSILE